MFVIIYKLYLNHIMFKYKIDNFHLWNDLFTEKQAKTLRELIKKVNQFYKQYKYYIVY